MILNRIRQIDFLIIVSFVLMALALCAIQYSDFDIKIQNHFFDSLNKTWLVDRNEPIKKFIFYKFPKILFGFVVTFCLVAAVLGFKKKSAFLFENRHKFLLIFLGLALIPLIAGNVKKFTNVYCPTQLEIYGGQFPYVKIFDKYPSGFKQIKRAQCFPAGHSVTGFAFFILFFALEKKSHRLFGLALALALGWIMALYQMFKGVHFFGDSLVSMLLCFLLAAVIGRIYLRYQNDQRQNN